MHFPKLCHCLETAVCRSEATCFEFVEKVQFCAIEGENKAGNIHSDGQKTEKHTKLPVDDNEDAYHIRYTLLLVNDQLFGKK